MESIPLNSREWVATVQYTDLSSSTKWIGFEAMAVQFALPAAVGFGVADFAGGLATRRTSCRLAVIAVAQLAGVAALLPVLPLLAGQPSVDAAVLGALAGLAGSGGLVLYCRGLAQGPMGVVAPLSGLSGAGLPLVVGLLMGERAGPMTLGGVGLALLAIALASVGTSHDRIAASGLLLGIASGLGFGLFFVALDASPPESGLWPLLAAKLAAIVVFGPLVLARRGAGRVLQLRSGLIVLSGAADMVSNILFLLATRQGELGVSAVLVSLYPVVVLVLARVLLRERLTSLQAVSMALALTAGALLSG
jgi:drug/metabolite transporter (DMT)-like permease